MPNTNFRSVLSIAIGCALMVSARANAADLLAIGQLSPTLHDLSGRTEVLENGVRADLFGGVGSSLAWAGGDTFLALPDRGPNAVSWNSNVDDTATYIPRFHTMRLELSAVPDPATKLPYTLRPTLLKTTLLYSHSPLNYGPSIPSGSGPSQWYFSGRSDNFDPLTSSADTRDARFDAEGIRVSHNGRFVYVSDEYGPYIYKSSTVRRAHERPQLSCLPTSLSLTSRRGVPPRSAATSRAA